MKVGQLMQLLKSVPATSDVLVSSDEEGNSFRPLGQVSKKPMADADGRGNFEYTDGAPEYIVIWPG